jgi:hypothetical protein
MRASVEGSGRVGYGRPFDLHVDLRHTKEIGRESGGFSKYLEKQNAQAFALNYGRPLEDYRDKFDEAARPDSFTFAAPKIEVATDERFRYVDADLESVGTTVSLERAYGEPSRAWMWWLAPVPVFAAVGLVAWRRLRRPRVRAQGRIGLPDPLTPFTVLGLLRDLERENGFGPEERRELREQILRIERHFFAEEEGPTPDLRRIAETWIARGCGSDSLPRERIGA